MIRGGLAQIYLLIQTQHVYSYFELLLERI